MSMEALLLLQDPLEQQFIAERMARARPAPLVARKNEHTEQGEFSDVEDFRRFMQAGNATFTIQSRKTGKRFTFKVTRPEPEQGRERPMWVKLAYWQRQRE